MASVSSVMALILLPLFTTLALVAAIYPLAILKIEANLYRRLYKDFLRMEDSQLDGRFQIALDRKLRGPLSEFIRDDWSMPERYRILLVVYRSIGILTLLLLSFTLLLIFA